MPRFSYLAAGAVVLVSACATVDMPEPPEGQSHFRENCVSCHGATGRGDGDLSAGLSPRPADLTRIAANNKGVFPRARVLSEIDGYTRGERGQEEMPEFGLLLRGDLVPVDTGDGVMTPTPRPLAALLAYLESIQQ